MKDALNVKVNVQIGPVEMAVGNQFHMKDFPDRRILEPREQMERQEGLLVVDEHPDAMAGDICDLNRRSVVATLRGSHWSYSFPFSALQCSDKLVGGHPGLFPG
jgi:hypothetical protein